MQVSETHPPFLPLAGDSSRLFPVHDPRLTHSLHNHHHCFAILLPIRDHANHITDFRIDYLNHAASVEPHFPLTNFRGQSLSALPPGSFGRTLIPQFISALDQPLRLDTFVATEIVDDQTVSRAFDIQAFPIHGSDPGGGAATDPALAVTWRDVTDRLNKQRSVDDIRQRLELALAAGDLGIWEFHFHTNLLFWAPRTTYLMTGVEVERIVDSDEFWARVHPDDRPAYRARVEAAMAGTGDMNTDYRIIRPDGQIRRIATRATILRDSRGNPVTVVGFISDITEQHAAAQALERRDLQHEAYFKYAPTSVAMVDNRMCYLAASRSFFANYGISPDFDPIGKCHYDVFPTLPQRWKDVHARCLKGAVESCEEDEYVMPNGSTEYIRWEIRPWREPDNSIGGIIIFVEQVTEKVLARREADAANAAKDHFLAILSHELRTPLTPVLALAQLLESHPDLPHSLREPLSTIRRNVDLETRLIDDLLDVTRIARGKLTLNLGPVNLHDTIRHTLAICREDLHAKNISVHLQLAADHPAVTGDHARLQQVLWNLLKNAVKFTPPNGSITITSSNTHNPDHSHDILLSLTDTGIGIDPDALKRIFKPFEQGEKITQQFGGLGLGLAISKSIVDLHKGSLSAHSAGPNTGSTFSIRLPNASAPAPAPPPITPAPASHKPLRILLVDDHADTRHAMAKLLKCDGHSVITAASVSEALAAANQHPFDLLISDIGLPDASGLDLMPLLAKSHRLPGIAVSGFGMESDLERSKSAGFSSHLIKPIRLEDLRTAIAQITH